MKVVSDAGPLIAFAKIGGLSVLHSSFRVILTPPAVFAEVVTAGLELQAPDAALIGAEYEAGRFETRSPVRGSLQLPAKLGRGEEPSMVLAMEERADLLLIDDRLAREIAGANFRAAGVDIRIQGTLGVIVSARVDGLISLDRAVHLVEALENRPDIWIHASLCQKVKDALLTESSPGADDPLP